MTDRLLLRDVYTYLRLFSLFSNGMQIEQPKFKPLHDVSLKFYELSAKRSVRRDTM